MDNRLTRSVAVALAAIVAFAASGCAGDSRRAGGIAHQDDLVRAEATIAEAEKSGAYERGSADLNRAREKLLAARKATEEGEDDAAQRLAIEAQLDAEVAAATARNQETQNAVAELNESVRTLRDELRRNEQRDLSRL